MKKTRSRKSRDTVPLRSPGFDSKESIQPAYVAWRVGTSNRVVVPAQQVGNRIRVSLKSLQLRALLYALFHIDGDRSLYLSFQL
jgi:hypothetical protein